MSSNKETRSYSIADLELFDSLDVRQIFENPLWSNIRFRETSLDFKEPRKPIIFLRIYSKIVTYEYPQLQIKTNKILSEVASDKYFSQLIGLLYSTEAESTLEIEQWIVTINNVLNLLHQLWMKIPTTALGSLGLCTCLISFIARLISASSDENINDTLLSIQTNVTDLRKNISEKLIRPEIEKRKEKRDQRKPPNDFREIPILPTRDDIFHEPFLRKNLTTGSYEDLNHYLDVQFRLLREDCIAQLRNGIFEYIETKAVHADREVRKLKDAKLYKNVFVVSKLKESSIEGPIYELQLDRTQVERIRWERSKRLLYGSLLCLSPDNFDTLYFAVIENVDYDQIKANCTFSVSMRKGPGQSGIQTDLPMTMVESTAYFESYRHVLCSLQTITEEQMPFKRYIVEGCKNIKPPRYVERNEDLQFDFLPIINQDVIFKVHNVGEEEPYSLLSDDWPSADELHVDESQLKALKFALTNEFVIIQGPPGTGKTHIGLEIAKVLLHNKRQWMNEAKINERFQFRRNIEGNDRDDASSAMLIVCYTNHALDQFMNGILDFLDPKNEREWRQKLVRVGSRCSNPRIEGFSLKHRRRYANVQSDHHLYLKLLEESHEKISRSKWRLTQSIQNIYDINILAQWVQEVGRLLTENDNDFDILKWLKVDADSLRQKAFKDYEQYEVAKTTDENDEAVQEQIENIIIETEAALINDERHVEDDEFENNLNFPEIGYNIDLIVEYLLKENDLDETFEKLLKQHANKAKIQLMSKDTMNPYEFEKAIKRPWKLSINQRWRMYRYFVQLFREEEKKLLCKEEQTFVELRKTYLREKQTVDRHILLHSEIIAMTTSGAARYQDVLKEVGPRVIIVEEAAEVLEAHIVATLNLNCEHLILIGDHKQLEPKPAVYELAEKYNLALSMFERMVNVGLPYVCLERQHRMRPEISQLVRPVYERLIDNENVLEYELVKGIEKNVFFISHNKEESTKEESQSYWNNHEAKFIQRLTQYLLKQGYAATQITILTPYSGQMFLLRDIMPRKDFDGIKISILDNYQGEENDIILLSLVRSNKEGKIGFLNKENRVCVALSRAKIGLYVIGNFDNIRKFSRKCKLWTKAIKSMETMGALGEGLPLFCSIHFSRLQAVHFLDFDQCPEGGCSLPCDIRRSCGHACPLFCHPRDPKHKNMECKKLCLKQCELNHSCQKRCHFPTDCMCDIKVEKILPCQHKKILSCCTTPETISCKEQVTKELPCGHKGKMLCCDNPLDFTCNELVNRTLDCGHSKDLPCHVNVESYKCEVLMRKTLPCKHEADMHCWKSPTYQKCETLVKRMLKCNHEKMLACHIDIASYKCMENVVKILQCGHELDMPCHKDVKSVICKVKITEKRTISITYTYRYKYSSLSFYGKKLTDYKCDHLYTRYCHEDATKFQTKNRCKEIITKTLGCGHEIEIECHMRDDDIKCQIPVLTEFACHHDNVSVPCHEKSTKSCRATCGKQCEEKHVCQKICHSPDPCNCKVRMKKQKECGHTLSVGCSVDVSKITCEEPVDKILKCGHTKTLACHIDINETSILCEEKVNKELKCKHFLDLPCYVNPDDSSIKCFEKTKKTIPWCGHTVFISCCKNPDEEECLEKVSIVRPDCGHKTKEPCYLDKQLKLGLTKKVGLPACKTPVPVKLKCGHVMNVACSEKENKLPVCMAKCESSLLCGHICSGTCSECSFNHHRECQKICSKVLVCGHKGTKNNCGNCGTCSESCSFACPHSVCNHSCNRECDTCTRQCDWVCQHYRCLKQCFEVCDRPKCNERCTMKLKCGHQCVGLCSDPCPKLCKKCDHGMFRQISKAKSSLVVELQECGHIFDYQILDKHMEEDNETFSVKRCPKCSTIIKWHPRYHVQLKIQNLKINRIRNTVNTVSRVLNNSAFPLLVGSGNNSLDFVTKFGTFLAVNEKSLHQADELMLAKSMLNFMRRSLQKADKGNQNYFCAYSNLKLLSILWKYFVIILYNTVQSAKDKPKEQKTEEDDSENEDFDETKDTDDSDDFSESEHEIMLKTELSKGCSKERSKKTSENDESNQEFNQYLDKIKNWFVKNKDKDTVWDPDIEVMLENFLPFLTDIGRGWMNTANVFPRLIAVVDIHSGSWRTCKIGKTYLDNYRISYLTWYLCL